MKPETRKSPREKHPVQDAVEGVKQEAVIEELDIEKVEVATIKVPVAEGKPWTPRTELGRKVLSGEINNIDQILDSGIKILEPEIVDRLVSGLEFMLVEVGQSKGKFGGGKGSIWKQTQKKTCEGNKPKFSTMAVVGNRNGYVGVGLGKSKETVPAREKATRRAKLNIIKIKRGCGSWECGCGEKHTIPVEVEGKSGSSRVRLMPAPKGVGLCVSNEAKKVMRLAGIKDMWTKRQGESKTRNNYIIAIFDAFKRMNMMRLESRAPAKEQEEKYEEVEEADTE